jgi:hypothetical protein
MQREAREQNPTTNERILIQKLLSAIKNHLDCEKTKHTNTGTLRSRQERQVRKLGHTHMYAPVLFTSVGERKRAVDSDFHNCQTDMGGL